jgi:hypothetical protein
MRAIVPAESSIIQIGVTSSLAISGSSNANALIAIKIPAHMPTMLILGVNSLLLTVPS